MLSTGLHQYTISAFNQLPSSNLLNHEQHLPSQRISTAGLDALAQSSQYALQHYPHTPHHVLDGKTFGKQRHHPYVNLPASSGSRNQKPNMVPDRTGRHSNAPVRRRISRACDQCNQLRTKCDGKAPCAHCIEFGLTCEYMRERKKRGKASRKEIAAQQAAAAAAAAAAEAGNTSPSSANGYPSEEQQGNSPGQTHERENQHKPPGPDLPPPSNGAQRSASIGSHNEMNGAAHYDMHHVGRYGSVGDISENGGHHQMAGPADGLVTGLATPRLSTNGVHDRNLHMMNMSDYGSMDDYQRAVGSPGAVNGSMMLQNGGAVMHHPLLATNGMQAYGDNSYTMLSPQSQHGQQNGFRIPPGESPLAGFLGNSPVAGSPGWLSLPSPSAALYSQQHMGNSQTLRYPVLKPLLPYLQGIIPVYLACDLLELYFQSASSAFMQPVSPYVLGYVFRKRSFLRHNNPRVCSPALLASMLWIGAQTHESAFLTSPPSTRGKVCQKLLELTISLLKPLIHTPDASNHASPNFAANTVINGVALGGFGVANPISGRLAETEGGTPGAAAALDDIVTYMHLAVVVSASEYKAASLRWWNAAWSLARELKLNRELPPSPPAPGRETGEDADAEGEVDMDVDMNGMNHGLNGQVHTPGTISEEEREERRRIWWLLYTMDRHLALCYNRPLFLLDVECEELLQPVEESRWQAGDYYTGNSDQYSDSSSPYYRRRGPSFEVTGHSIFGYFTPLMTILGAIVDLNHARNHPRFGSRFRNGDEWDHYAAELSQQLEAYGRSLEEFEKRFTSNLTAGNDNDGAENGNRDAGTPSAHSVNSSGSRITESIIQTKIVVAYATHLMHTLHILVNGKWDPISLLDDNDLWISSQSFVTATGHAVSAAEALSDILEHDPDLSFMPFFFGMYLLQGSFLLLLIADKLQGEASPSVVKACETIVRAHEACVVTLNTEYQRNFRKVMRSALAQVRGRCLEDFGEQQQRRREVLALYRWTGDGSGLAL
ncbi:Xylanolytic transcriptional activator xlnR [Lasiodiplodia theobromae]|uniref:Xylanolytic transcriptional activator xlnR n=1 Tax=Lasiodiplodia theobromae TaxID=45133 RepID=A0A5N5DCB9_9PEZI|nr:Xylanolytic transcriptional activator xlnR [Lasiodiplodia theobromae]